MRTCTFDFVIKPPAAGNGNLELNEKIQLYALAKRFFHFLAETDVEICIEHVGIINRCQLRRFDIQTAGISPSRRPQKNQKQTDKTESGQLKPSAILHKRSRHDLHRAVVVHFVVGSYLAAQGAQLALHLHGS